MIKINPTIILAYKIVIVMLSALAAGSLYRPSFISLDVAKDIQGISTSLVFLLTAIHTVITPDGSQTAFGAQASKTLCLALLAALLAPCILSPSPVEAATHGAPLPTRRPVGFSLQSPDQIIDKIRAWATGDAGADLDAAIALGTAANNPVTVPCFKAIRSFVTVVQALPTADKLPKIHLAVDIEILTDLEVDLLPNSPVITSCTALANFQAVSAQNLVTGIVSGALALSKFAPVIPPI